MNDVALLDVGAEQLKRGPWQTVFAEAETLGTVWSLTVDLGRLLSPEGETACLSGSLWYGEVGVLRGWNRFILQKLIWLPGIRWIPGSEGMASGRVSAGMDSW